MTQDILDRCDGNVGGLQGDGWALHIKEDRHIGDFSRWKDHDAYQKALKRLLGDLRAVD